MGDVEDLHTAVAAAEAVEAEAPPPAPLGHGERVCVRTFGCAHATSDSDAMRAALVGAGFIVVVNEDDDDATAAVSAVVINGCTAKTPSHDAFVALLRRTRAAGRAVVAAGCMSLSALRFARADAGVAVLGVDHIARVAEAVRCAVDGVPFVALARTHAPPPLTLPAVPENAHVATVAAASGCVDRCAYCRTVIARGRLRSHPVSAVVDAVLRRVSRGGLIEVRLTGEDMGAFGLDIGASLPMLVRAVADALQALPQVEKPMLRVGMANPRHLAQFAEEYGALLCHPRVFAFAHLPIQSGSDRVLQSMNRRCTVAEFERVVTALRAACPTVTIATDLIVGYPTETDEDFAQTLAFVARHRFPILYTNTFFSRPGSPAARLRQLPAQVVKARVKAISDLFRSYTSFDSLVGTTAHVWVAERSHRGGQWAAHTKEYVQVLLDAENPAIRPGTSLEVRIVSAGKWSVVGEPLQCPAPGG